MSFITKFVYFRLSADDKNTEGVGKLRMRPEDFNLIKVIGRGAYGEVQLVSLILSGWFLNVLE